VGVTTRIDPPTDLRHPQIDAVVLEQGEGQAELVAVERAGRFTDDDSVEPPGRVLEGGQQGRCFGAALPGQGAGQADVEELGDDPAAVRSDQRSGTRQLPLFRGFRDLLI